MSISDLLGDLLPRIFNENEKVRLELMKSGIVNIFGGTTGTKMAGNCYVVFQCQGIQPSFHIIESEEDSLPYDIPRTLLDINGGGKLYIIFKPIVRANQDKIRSELSVHDETFAIQYGTPIGSTGANMDTTAKINRELGRSVLTIYSIREGNQTTNEIQNIHDNVKGFLEVREEWGGMMEVFKPEVTVEKAMIEIENFCFVVNNSAIQKSLNPRDLTSIVEKHPFGIMLTERVKVPYKTNPNLLYDKMLSRVRVLQKKGFLNTDAVELTVFMHGPPDLLEYKDTIVGYVKQAFINSDISVKGNFEPFLSYNYLASNRNLWVHTIVPTDMEKYCKQISGRRSRRRKRAK